MHRTIEVINGVAQSITAASFTLNYLCYSAFMLQVRFQCYLLLQHKYGVNLANIV